MYSPITPQSHTSGGSGVFGEEVLWLGIGSFGWGFGIGTLRKAKLRYFDR